LLAFGGIALFVGSFVIANSLSITIAQRTREFATLRTLGATRRQVLRSVILESVIMGVLASVTGLLLGLLLAIGLFKLFDSFGLTLPNNGLVFQTRTIVVALAVGIVITVLASLRPAVRATRVPPIAAVREGATLPPGRFHRYRWVGATLLMALGFAGIIVGLFVKGLGTAQVLIFMLGGALLVFIGVALFSSRLVRPLAAGGQSGCPLVRHPLLDIGLAVLHVAVLAAAVWRLGPGCDRAAGRCVCPRCGAEPADTADRPRDGR
jgi:putative ABC transport system permease protein